MKGKTNKNRKNKWKYTVWLCAIVFIFNFVQIFQGIDLTDEGIFIVNEERSFPTPEIKTEVYGQSTLFLTNYIGGAWLHIYPEPSMIFVRLGSVLIQVLLAMFAFLTITKFSEPKKAFFPMVAFSLFFSAFQPKIINYMNLPALFCILIIYFMTLGIDAKKGLKKNLYFVISGIIVVAAGLSLFNLVVFMFVLPLAVGLLYIFTKDKKLKNAWLWTGTGVLLGIGLFALMLWNIGYLSSYITQIYTTIIKGFISNNADYFYGHKLNFTIYLFVRDFIRTIIVIIIAAAALHFGDLIEKKSRLKLAKPLLVIAAILIGGLFAFKPFTAKDVTYLVLYSLATLITLIALVFCFMDYIKKKKYSTISHIFIILILYLWAIPTASDGGLFRISTGMWIIAPLAFIKIDSIKLKLRSWKKFQQLKNTILASIVIIAILFSLFMFAGTREFPRYRMTEPFEDSSLKFIYSDKSKTVAVDTILSIVKNYTDPGDVTLFVADAPLLHYLTDTTPLYGEGWVLLETYEQIQKFEKENDYLKKTPELVLFSHYMIQEAYWPEIRTPLDEQRAKISSELKDKYKSKGYALVYKDELFEVYVLPEG